MARPNKYPDPLQVGRIPPATAYRFDEPEPTVTGVERAFDVLSRRGNYLAAWDGKQIRGWRYTSSILNRGGLDNHFQGVQRLRGGPYLVVSGGDSRSRPMSHLFVVHLPSREGPNAWGSNLRGARRPPLEDRIVGRVDVDGDLWHAGGLSLFGHVLAVPIEHSKEGRSRIVFFDFARPTEPRRFDRAIDRPEHKAGAVALTRLENGRFLCAVWSDSEGHVPRQRLDLYLSQSEDFSEGFEQHPMTIVWCVRRWAKFQAISFVRQARDRALYLLGFETEIFAGVTAPVPFLLKNLSPTFSGKNYGRLFRVECDESRCDRVDALASMRFEYVNERRFWCRRKQCNMDAASGAYVTADGQLLVYSVYHWRMYLPSWNLIRASEFVPGSGA